jgi:hypothetical protein
VFAERFTRVWERKENRTAFCPCGTVLNGGLGRPDYAWPIVETGRKGDGLTLESCRRVRRKVVRGGVVVRFRFEGLEVVQVRRMRGRKQVRLESFRIWEISAGAAETLAVSLGGGDGGFGSENCFRRISLEASLVEGSGVELGKRRCDGIACGVNR